MLSIDMFYALKGKTGDALYPAFSLPNIDLKVCFQNDASLMPHVHKDFDHSNQYMLLFLLPLRCIIAFLRLAEWVTL